MVKSLTLKHGDDKKTADAINKMNINSATGKPFTAGMVRWIRFKHKINLPVLREDYEWTIAEVCDMFNISRNMAYYWIENKYVEARKTPTNKFLIKITPDGENQIINRIKKSCKSKYMVGNDFQTY